MDPRLQASFIPKKPFTESNPSKPVRGEGINFFLLIGAVLFILTIVAAIGVFVLNIFEQRSITSKADAIQSYEQKYSASSYQGFEVLNTRIETAQQLLSQHIATSEFFNILGAATAQDISFTSLTYAAGATTTASVILQGVGKNFNAVAFQSDAFQNVPALEDVIFSGIKLDSKGLVDFGVNAAVNTADFLYSNEFAPAPAAVAPATTPTTSSVATSTATTSSH